MPTRHIQPIACGSATCTSVAPRGAQDREALAHALAEVARHADRVAQQEQPEQHQHADGDPCDPGMAHRQRELERRQVRQLGHARHDALDVGVGEQARADDRVEQRLDEQRGDDRRDARLGQPQAHEVELQQVAAAGGDQRVEPDARQVRAGARAPAVAHRRVGGAQDRVPGARPQQQVGGVEEQRDRERGEADVAEPMEERLAGVDELVDVAHSFRLRGRDGRFGELPVDHAPRRCVEAEMKQSRSAFGRRARIGLDLPAADDDARAAPG